MALLLPDGQRLEHAWHGPPPERAPTLVLLHEGLGCVTTWRDVPARLAAATGMGALVYSRRGYGASDPVTPPRPLDYMEREGLAVLPAVLDAAGVRRAVLVGHSDGASIALVHAGRPDPDPRVAGLALEAPHLFCEELSVRSIAAAREAFLAGDLRARLERHHGVNTEGAFWGWNRAWLDPAFRAWTLEPFARRVQVPVLVIQGAGDEYGTLAQVEAVERFCPGPVERLVLPACGHAPHRDQPEAALAAIARFASACLAAPA